jgi:tRNA modification GTPase
LLDLSSSLEASIDYPDDIVPPEPAAIGVELAESAAAIDRLLATADEGRLVRDGVRLAIVGKPNVGKSSLLNRLMEAERAIVSDVPGTTRDTIEEAIVINGLSFVLVDTAGIRSPNDRLEAEGVSRAAAEFRRADLAMIVLDASSALSVEDERVLNEARACRFVVVLNKIDLGIKLPLSVGAGAVDKFMVSALTGDGFERLRTGLVAAVLSDPGDDRADGPALINARHKEALQRAREALERASVALSQKTAPDLLTIDLKAAIGSLGEMSGQEISEEIVENIFQRFCVGK